MGTGNTKLTWHDSRPRKRKESTVQLSEGLSCKLIKEGGGMAGQVEQKWFEAWFMKAFKGKEILLEKEKDNSYKDETIQAMFVGFAGAWNCK